MESNRYTLKEVIDAGIESALLDHHTSLPAEVVSYDKSDQTVQVKVSIAKSIYGEVVEYPILDKIPVVFPRTKKSGLTFPIESGDEGLLVFIERNIDKWYSSGSGSAPLDGRRFDINDAVFIAGLFNMKNVMEPSQEEGVELRGKDLLIGNSETESINISSKTLTIGSGDDSIDLVDILSETMQLLATQMFPTAVGNSGVSLNASDFQQLKAKLDQIKGA